MGSCSLTPMSSAVIWLMNLLSRLHVLMLCQIVMVRQMARRLSEAAMCISRPAAYKDHCLVDALAG